MVIFTYGRVALKLIYIFQRGERMSTKRKIMLVILSVVLVLGAYFIFSFIPHKLVNIEPSEVSSVYIFDGATGKEFSITGRNDIEHIIGNLNSITFKKDGWSLGYMGYSFRTTIYKANGKVYKEFIINSADTVRDDPFFYRDSTNSIDYSYIRNLIDKQGS